MEVAYSGETATSVASYFAPHLSRTRAVPDGHRAQGAHTTQIERAWELRIWEGSRVLGRDHACALRVRSRASRWPRERSRAPSANANSIREPELGDARGPEGVVVSLPAHPSGAGARGSTGCIVPRGRQEGGYL